MLLIDPFHRSRCITFSLSQALFTRLRKKYMDEAAPAVGGIQYAPMDILLG